MDNGNSKRFQTVFILVLLLFTLEGFAQNSAPLRHVQTISLPNVKGRIDHMAAVLKGPCVFTVVIFFITIKLFLKLYATYVTCVINDTTHYYKEPRMAPFLL